MDNKDVSVSLLWLIVILFFGIGLLGTVIPGLPGITLMYAGILVHALATDFARISLLTVLVFGLVTALTLAFSDLGSAMGTRVGGRKKRVILGTLAGALAGAFSGPAGLFLGGFLGAFVGALLEGRSRVNAFKFALFSVSGILGSVVIQFLLGTALIIAFLISVAF